MSRSSLSLLVLAASLLSVCRGQLGISSEDMQGAVRSLSDTFTRMIRDDGLGVNLMEVSLCLDL